MLKLGSIGPILLGAALLSGCVHRPKYAAVQWPVYTLRAMQTTLLTPPSGSRFDASALQIMPDGSMLTVGNDHGATPYRIDFQTDRKEAKLVPLTTYFPTNAVTLATTNRHGALDAEGFALDDQRRLYVCLERDRWILRGDATGRVDRLPIDWTPVEHYFSKIDPNASFEGIAIGGGRLYVSNERTSPVIIVVDLATLKVKRDFVIAPSKSSLLGLHYSDLCWFGNHLWILCRQHYVVLEIDPATRQVVAEFDYREIEDRLSYATGLPIGIMEGLAVDGENIWLATDNNGDDRKGARGDRRPTLIQCRRPDR